VNHFKLKALMENKKAWLVTFCYCSALVLSGCKQDSQIETYTVTKKTAYKLPSNWKQTENTSAMRLATFEVTGENEEIAEVAILPMPDLKVEDHEIVNLWRSQLQLEPITKEEVDQSSESVQIGEFEGRIFDLTAPDTAPGEMSGMRIITAFVNSPVGTWFFKMTGASQHLENERAGFTSFLESMSLHEMQQQITSARSAADPHAGMNMAGSGTPPPNVPTAQPSANSSNLPTWNVPSGWASGGPSSMILASFNTSGEGGDAKITVTSMGGGAGGLLPNINRWRGQVGLGPASANELDSIATEITVSGNSGKLVIIAGSSQRIDAAIVPHAGQTWFFKAMGAPAAVQRESEAFKSFIQSVQFNENAQ
jgi:hypothetical protein